MKMCANSHHDSHLNSMISTSHYDTAEVWPSSAGLYVWQSRIHTHGQLDWTSFSIPTFFPLCATCCPTNHFPYQRHFGSITTIDHFAPMIKINALTEDGAWDGIIGCALVIYTDHKTNCQNGASCTCAHRPWLWYRCATAAAAAAVAFHAWKQYCCQRPTLLLTCGHSHRVLEMGAGKTQSPSVTPCNIYFDSHTLSHLSRT